VTSHFTLSVETGNFLFKKEVGLNKDPGRTYESAGLGDLIIFPRYDVLNRTNTLHSTEITVGLGYKIPMGSYNDSTGRVEPFSGQTYYVTNPQAVQLSSGAQDIIFYSFFYRGFIKSKFRVFASALYIKKGWNPLGEKMGDFASIGLFAGKSFLDHFGLTVQLRAEWMKRMQLNETILQYAYPNYDPEATGYKKVFFTPQVNFSSGKFTLYVQTDIPLYQYVTKSQVGTQIQGAIGLSFRLSCVNQSTDKINPGVYYCPMHHEVTSLEKGKCPICGMDLIRK